MEKSLEFFVNILRFNRQQKFIRRVRTSYDNLKNKSVPEVNIWVQVYTETNL